VISAEQVTFNELGTATKPLELTKLQQKHRNNLDN